MAQTVIIVGAGAFGVSSAIALAEDGWEVTLVDPGPLPHPLAASTDISKIIRADYGADELYIELMEETFPRWEAWNQAWGTELYHQTGFLILSAGAMDPGTYEHTSYNALAARQFPLDRIPTAEIAARYGWTLPDGVEGYVNRRAGWAESGAVVSRLLEHADDLGVQLIEARVTELDIRGSQVTGVVIADRGRLAADVTVVAAGAWTAGLVPGLDGLITTTGHPIIHLSPDDPEPFSPPHFLPWAADIANTGWYGFPAIGTGVVKVANHGAGQALAADDDRRIAADWEAHFRAFLSERLPGLAGAPITDTRLCLYTDTTDGDFLIDRHPDLEGLVVATGGSGHGFKFAPVIGDLVLEAIQDRPRYGRFRWRSSSATRKEPARAKGLRPGSG